MHTHTQINIFLHVRSMAFAFLLIGGLLPFGRVSALRVVSYNVENLFDCERDSVHDDSEYTEDGARHWNSSRYYHKREQIARTIVNIGQWDGVDIVGLCEVENAHCMEDLCRQNMAAIPYSFVHFDSPDTRGIDVSILYRTDRFRILNTYPLRVPTMEDERPTRDILYTCGVTPAKDTLHLYVCHLPSRLGGTANKAGLRKRAKQVLETHVDSILRTDSRARIIVMGDMNSAPEDDISGMTNMMIAHDRAGRGTYKYQGEWSCIDQFYVSSSLAESVQTRIYDAPWLLTTDEQHAGFKPLRTYNGYTYQADGHSDHLPIVLEWNSRETNMLMHASLDQVMEDIYLQITEDNGGSELTDFETLQEELQTIHSHPIPLNNTNYDALSQLPFLSEEQIAGILTHAAHIPFRSLYELQLVHELKDYEIRNLLSFVEAGSRQQQPFYWRELGAYGVHDVSLRTDVRNAEGFEGTDPVYVQAKYSYSFKRNAAVGVTLRRPAGGRWNDLAYGGYIQLSDIGHLKRLVGGCYQARFGEGLVTNHFFHTGKSSMVMLTGGGNEGLSRISSASDDRYQGIGATVTVNRHWETSAWYSVDNDKVWHHAIGANVRANYNHLRVGLTVMEHLYSDSLPVRNTYYNQAYFRGKHQFVIGANIRYSFRQLHLFCESAVAENTRWGWAAIAGIRYTPLADLGIVGLYRYYSPDFDNRYGYAFSESSRIGNEQGGYVGVEYKGLRRWRFSAYGDVFHFARPKFGIRDSSTTGYDVLGQVDYIGGMHHLLVSARSRLKGSVLTNRGRIAYTYNNGHWRLHTQADASFVRPASGATWTYGVSVYQDIEYHVHAIPMVLQLRLQGFDVQDWASRIYLYENDVLYAFSIPATYGRGGRVYLNMRYVVVKGLSMYLRVSETVYHPAWASAHTRPVSRTDVHVLLRAQLSSKNRKR